MQAAFGEKGSPPQVRGKQTLPGPSNTGARITPAGAGKTRSGGVYHGGRGDHPRRCGENMSLRPRQAIGLGSPPQVRGKHNATHQSIADNRITPAGAGKTSKPASVGRDTPDHPRRCGENLGFWVFGVRQMGSPPQVRGKRAACAGLLRRAGITPAGAGKTDVSIASSRFA